jgi:hypothetical protein
MTNDPALLGKDWTHDDPSRSAFRQLSIHDFAAGSRVAAES